MFGSNFFLLNATQINPKIGAKTITKKDLESLNAWDEVEDWFKKINELVSKVGKNVDND